MRLLLVFCLGFLALRGGAQIFPQYPLPNFHNQGPKIEKAVPVDRNIECPKLLSRWVRLQDGRRSFFSWWTGENTTTACESKKQAQSARELEEIYQSTSGVALPGLPKNFLNRCLSAEEKELSKEFEKSPNDPRAKISEEQKKAIVADYYWGMNRLTDYAKGSLEALAAIDVMLGKRGPDFLKTEKHQLLSSETLPGSKEWLQKIRDPRNGCKASEAAQSKSTLSKSLLFEQSTENLVVAGDALLRIRSEIQLLSTPGRHQRRDPQRLAKLRFGEAQILKDNPLLESPEFKKLMKEGLTPDSERQGYLKKLQKAHQFAVKPTGRGARPNPERAKLLLSAIHAAERGERASGAEFQVLVKQGLLPSESFEKIRERAMDRYRLALLLESERKREAILSKLQLIRESANCLNGDFDSHCQEQSLKVIMESPPLDPFLLIADDNNRHSLLARHELGQSECRYAMREAVAELAETGNQALIVMSALVPITAGAKISALKQGVQAGKLAWKSVRAKAIGYGVALGAGEAYGITDGFLSARESCADSAMSKVKGLKSSTGRENPQCAPANLDQITASRDYASCQLAATLALVGVAGGTLGNLAILKSAKGATETLTESGLSKSVSDSLTSRLQTVAEEGARRDVAQADTHLGRALQRFGQSLRGRSSDDRTIRFLQIVKGLDDKTKALLNASDDNANSLVGSLRQLDEIYHGKIPDKRVNQLMATFVKNQPDMDALKGFNRALTEARKRAGASATSQQIKKNLEEYLRESLPSLKNAEIKHALECVQTP